VTRYATSLATRESPVAQTSARILEGLAVPYNTPTELAAGLVEVIAAGAFTEWIRTHNSAPLLLFHDNRSLSAIIGRGTFREDAAGLWGLFTLRDTPAAQEAAQLATDGVLSLSIGFQPRASVEHMDRLGNLTVTRTACRLLEVSLTPTPAYVDATVTAVRAHALARSVDVPTLDLDAARWHAHDRRRRRA
jgi:HK97 family phage prohead protease